MSAGHFDQNVGPLSRIGLFHPGPMWFYWCAPFLRLSRGEPTGLFLAALTLVSVCAGVILEQVRRSLGISAALVTALTLAVSYLSQESGSVTTLVQGDIARWAGADLLLARDHRPRRSAPILMLGLAIISFAAALMLRGSSAWRCDRSDLLGWLGVVAVTGLVLQAVVAVRARGEFRPYLIAVSAGAGVVAWLVAALVAHRLTVTRLGSMTAAGRSVLKAAAGVAIAVPLVLFLGSPLEGFPPGLQPSQDASQQLESALDGRYVRVRVDRIDTLLFTQQLVAALERSGWTVTVEGREVAHFSDRQRREDPGAILIEAVPAVTG